MRFHMTLPAKYRTFLEAEAARTNRSLANIICYYIGDRPEFREFYNAPIVGNQHHEVPVVEAPIDPSPQQLEVPDQAFFDRIRRENENPSEPPPYPKPAT
jgi:hypothetical protein